MLRSKRGHRGVGAPATGFTLLSDQAPASRGADRSCGSESRPYLRDAADLLVVRPRRARRRRSRPDLDGRAGDQTTCHVDNTGRRSFAAGGAVGAPARYVVDRASGRFDSSSHCGTIDRSTSPVPSSSGRLTGLRCTAISSAGNRAPLERAPAAPTTTFSTFSYETVRLAESGQWLEATFNLGMSMVAGLAGAIAGLAARPCACEPGERLLLAHRSCEDNTRSSPFPVQPIPQEHRP